MHPSVRTLRVCRNPTSDRHRVPILDGEFYGSWKNERAYYNASNGRVKNYTDNPYSNEEIKAINEKVSYKMKMSSLAIKNNYFNYLENALEKYKVESNVVAQANGDNAQEG